ncbi:unnamed protein product (macronuclear) [Paramecium tetraurelia]|uniref:Uncharacterized protein n=1 Tax=Paramecium tetraurelia TaxID=5888 RepID=A0CWP1_PARTE|nr:uncharacterized protein GSPATT00001411001 [Paramecium tetraurelia]CAK75208.1 unnamed protein product [Paramecium tetraurelia]|eukprot:XP_001442605.1 hypothetical protein (macronuclear) [Paramecium tetraurelia strain d4-2]
MINSQSQPNHLNQSAFPISEPTLEQINRKQYGDTLRQQIDQKKMRQQQEKIQERLLELQLANGQTNSGRGGGGAPLRDPYGNITTTRKNPMDPNLQSAQLFGPSNSSLTSNQFDNMSISQFPSQQQRLITSNQSMFNLPVSNNSMNQSQLSYIGEQIALNEKRQKQFMLQRELVQQMEDADRKKQEEKLRIKRDKELDDLRVIREREELERKMRDEFGIDKLEKRNLQETNFDVDGLKALKRLEMLKYQNELIEQQNRKNAKTGVRQRTPVQDAERNYKDQQNDLMKSRIEQRIIKELPIEVEKTVRDTINAELQRLRQEMNLQTNQVSEQVVQLKGQLLKANENRHYNEDQLRRLKEELRQTQIVDEIRQRELYQAFLSQDKTRQIIDTTQRLMTPESVKFTFPKRPRPYYNLADPYLGTNDEANKDLNQIFNDTTQMVPVSYDFGSNNYDKDRIEDKLLYSKEEMKENGRLGVEMNPNDLQMPEDYLNRQKLYVAKKYVDTRPGNNYDLASYDKASISPQTNYVSLISSTHPHYIMEEDEVKDVIHKYSDKLDKLEEIDAHQQRKNYNQMDSALQDLLEQQQNKINRIDQYKEHFEYNDYYSPDYQGTKFYNKMANILSN